MKRPSNSWSKKVVGQVLYFLGGCLNFPGRLEAVCNIEAQYNQNPAQLC